MQQHDKGMSVQAGENKLFGIDFHDFLQKEASGNRIEAASEFGVTPKDVRKLKKQLERS